MTTTQKIRQWMLDDRAVASASNRAERAAWRKTACVLALTCSLATGCSSSGSNSDDLGNGADMSGDGGGSDMSGGPGGPALSLIAGQIGGSGNADWPGVAARFYYAGSLTWDAGKLYVADTQVNQTIRSIDTATGVVSTVSSRITSNALGSVASDGMGNIYIGLNGPGAPGVGKLVLSTKTMTVIAGGSTSGSSDGMGSAAQFSGVKGVAWDGVGSLYVVDSGSSTIRKVAVATGDVTTLAGSAGMTGNTDGMGTAARFKNPTGLTWDGSGNLYVNDTGNNSIRKVVAMTGAVSTVVNMATGNQDPVWDGAGNFYFASGVLIRKLAVATGMATTIAGSTMGTVDGVGAVARFYSPSGVTFDGAGNLYVADYFTVRKVNLATAAVTTLAGAPVHMGAIDAAGSAALFSLPIGMAGDGAGKLYVADSNNKVIRVVLAATGDVTTLAGTAGLIGSTDGVGPAARFSFTQGMTWAAGGILYVTDNSTIRKIVVATGAVTTVAGSAGMTGTIDGIGSAARFNQPGGVTVDSTGNIFVADTGNSTIRQIDPTGAVTTFAGAAGVMGNLDGVGTAARFHYPGDVVADGAGNLYVMDTTATTIRKIDIASRTVTTVAGKYILRGSTDGIGTAARFSYPQHGTYDGAGHLYISDNLGNAEVRKLTLATGAVSTVVGVASQTGVYLAPLPAGLSNPRGLAWIPGRGLAISDSAENAILLAPLQ